MPRADRRLALVGYDFQLSRLRQAVVPRLPFSESLDLDLCDDGYEERLRAFAPDLVIQYGSETTDPPRDILNRRYRLAPALAPTIFAENAWLPQSDYLYLDEEGLAEQSSIARLGPADLPRVDRVRLDETLDAYRRRVTPPRPRPPRESFLLLCLQLPDDTVIIRASPFQDMQRLIDVVEAAFAGTPIIVRPHPQDSREYRTRRATLRRDGSAAAWIERAGLVLACNSTTLLEALALGVPAVALGRGIFSNKGVCWAWDGDANRLRQSLEFRPLPDRVDAFLWELARRQVPLSEGMPDHSAHNPVLKRLLEHWS